MKYSEILKKYEKLSHEKQKEVSALKLLLMHVTSLSSTELIIKIDEEMEEVAANKFEKEAYKYIYENVPVQHLVGYDYFYGYKFVVNKDVLIPRYETEELVQNVLMYYDEVFNGEKVTVVDIGTGSGAIAIALANEEENMDVTATDISKEALKTAEINNKNNNEKVKLLWGDLFSPLEGKKFDIIVSNPPYIPENEYVDPLVKDNEPAIALFGGNDGLYFYRLILKDAKNYLNDRFIIAFEHGYTMGKEIHDLARLYFKNEEIILLKDMQGKDRMTFIIKR